jgi:hypothetical protein
MIQIPIKSLTWINQVKTILPRIRVSILVKKKWLYRLWLPFFSRNRFFGVYKSGFRLKNRLKKRRDENKALLCWINSSPKLILKQITFPLWIFSIWIIFAVTDSFSSSSKLNWLPNTLNLLSDSLRKKLLKIEF